MKIQNHVQNCNSIYKNIINIPIERAYNSIGSNIFLKLGKDKEILFENGRTFITKEWVIWISHASWRLTKNNELLVGSTDPSELIQCNLEKLLNLKLKSFNFVSDFLDIEIEFDNYFTLRTFFNRSKNNEWTIFLSNNAEITIDCSTQEKIKEVQDLAEQLPVVETYKKIDLPLDESEVFKITYDENQEKPIFIFKNGMSICLIHCEWRLEKNNQYLGGLIDDYYNKTKSLTALVGKKLKQIEVANPMMDARFEFEEGYVLKTFTCVAEATQWDIWSGKTPIFEATIELEDQI